MSLRPTLILACVTALALGACGYSGQDEPHESGANRLPEAEPPVSARETTPDSPQAGDTEADDPGTAGTGELVDPPTVEDEGGQESGETEPGR